MPIDFMCRCGKRYKAADHDAGRRFTCKACGGASFIPDPSTPDDGSTPDPDADDGKPAPLVVTVPPSPTAAPPTPLALDLGADRPLSKLAAREPWYYRFLTFYAGLLLVVGLIQAAVVTYLYLTPELRERRAVDTPGLMLSWGVALGSVLASTTVLLALDAARQLRAIRAAA